MIKNPKLLLLLIVLFCANLAMTFYLREQNQQIENELIKKVGSETTELNLQGLIRK